MAFIEPMHRNKPNITYLLTLPLTVLSYCAEVLFSWLRLFAITIAKKSAANVHVLPTAN